VVEATINSSNKIPHKISRQVLSPRMVTAINSKETINKDRQRMLAMEERVAEATTINNSKTTAPHNPRTMAVEAVVISRQTMAVVAVVISRQTMAVVISRQTMVHLKVW